MPYAEAMVFESAPIDLCPPGGVHTLRALAAATGVDPDPLIPAMEQKAKPPQLAVIREKECIGCTKCIQACPVDAILGSAKQMHTVIASECTGCELCIPPCPVDCIDLITLSETQISEAERFAAANFARTRHLNRQHRLAKENTEKQHAQKKISRSKNQSYIQAAIARVKSKKASSGKS